MHKINDSGKGG